MPSFFRDKNELMFQLMEYFKDTLADTSVVFGLERALKILFLIVHGLSVARRYLCFSHRDLHGKNIMFSPLKSTDLSLEIGEGEHVVVEVNILPKIIDFDTAIFLSDDEESDDVIDAFQAHSDIVRLRADFNIAIKKRKFTNDAVTVLKEIFETTVWKAGENSHRDQPEYLDAILRLPQFRSIYKPVENPMQNVEEKCSVCPRVATQMWEGTRWKFCDGSCAYLHKTINRFV